MMELRSHFLDVPCCVPEFKVWVEEESSPLFLPTMPHTPFDGKQSPFKY